MQASEEVPEYIQKLYNVRGKVGEGTYGVVYLASPKENQRKLLAIKTFKPGKVDHHLAAGRLPPPHCISH